MTAVACSILVVLPYVDVYIFFFFSASSRPTLWKLLLYHTVLKSMSDMNVIVTKDN